MPVASFIWNIYAEEAARRRRRSLYISDVSWRDGSRVFVAFIAAGEKSLSLTLS